MCPATDRRFLQGIKPATLGGLVPTHDATLLPSTAQVTSLPEPRFPGCSGVIPHRVSQGALGLFLTLVICTPFELN